MPRFIGPVKGPLYPSNPDTILSKQLTAGTGEAFDLPPHTEYVRMSCGSTAAGFETFFVNFGSTKAALPTTAFGISTHGSSAFNIPVGLSGNRTWQTSTSLCTGFSLISPSSVYVCVEFWSRSGATST
jgi:hypothetical protein